MLTTPVVFILFNRPDKTAQSFSEIAAAKPRQLFLIADGPRTGHPTDEANCAAARAVVEKIDWECSVHRHYSEQNLGCKRRVSSGLDWVFEQVEEAIIVEDDIVAGPDFFWFLQAMLAQYRDDARIMHVCGTNELPADATYPYSYYFSRWPSIWGWGTWRRAWQKYDVQMNFWSPELRAQLAKNPIFSPRMLAQFERTFAGEVDTWDYQWLLSVTINSGLSIIPRRSLIQNIGFGPDATHTTEPSTHHVTKPAGALRRPLAIPPFVMVDHDYEAAIAAKHRSKRFGRLRGFLKKMVKQVK